MWRVLLLVKVSLLSACIYLPPRTDEPYDEEALSVIHAQETTREEVVALLGQPSASRMNDEIWIYFEVRSGIIVAPLFYPGAAPVPDYQFVLIEFENEVVSNYEYIEDVVGPSKDSGCSSSNICLRFVTGIGQASSDLVVTGRSEYNQIAKEFRTRPDMCSLYIYSGWSHSSLFELDKEVYAIPAKSYFHDFLTPGTKTVVFPSLPSDYEYGYYISSEAIQRTQFECQEATLVFLELRMFGFILIRAKFYVEEVDYERGSEAIIEKSEIVILP